MSDAKMQAIIKDILDQVEIEVKRLAYQQELKEKRLKMIEDGTVELCEGVYRFYCPHCLCEAEVLQNQVACKIFRHAAFKANKQPINPHCPKAQCEENLAKDLVYGCTGPFEFNSQPGGGFKVQICEYK